MPPSLSFSDPAEPGITRRLIRGKWGYFDAGGERITDRDEIDRLNKIALPPAYRDAWFCPDPHGHIQAIGWDEKGRKQYRYHLGFREAQEAAKYERTADFGDALPKLRQRVDCDLSRRALGRDTVVAAIVRLLDLGRVRVGNDAYAKANKSFGATTLRDRHAKFSKGRLHLEYLGKSGKTQRITVEDRRLATIVKRCQDLPGQRLFQYVDGDGHRHAVGSVDVNDYIRDATGTDFTAKHFRTWGASVIAFETLLASGDTSCSLKAMLEPVAQALGNTPAIARKSYVHPALIELTRQGACIGGLKLPRATRWMRPAERGLIGFLREVAAEKAAEAERKAA
ncbi:DNA topoisomerase IB [Sphingomonas jatrophae]|uniref:DNA topoisomerase n=1 Tax=Sphingomonas jatrophae TaxID=1166337 RepID=A0A1I6LHN5_9SPHN|nr:DNA topoisomerase IB [Sphingomonas jatrophae]SFS02883.1 DNA topoisomerase-1 [Sphingomonas jatrophae]